MWKKMRIAILLLILAGAVRQMWLEEVSLNWQKPFYVVVYPISVDNTPEVTAYIQHLNTKDFAVISNYFAAEAAHYQLALHRPIEVVLGPIIQQIPPAPPQEPHALAVIWWSLKFRLYAWYYSPKMATTPNIQLYLLYHNPNLHPVLSHSTALKKGRIGRVNLFADPDFTQKNWVVLAHELLHTVKATDKYDASNNLPTYPEGFAEPNKQPLYPQQTAELMAGRVPFKADYAYMPDSLDHTMIGEKTAREIGWIK